MVTSLQKYRDQIGLREDEELTYAELRLPRSLDSYAEEDDMDSDVFEVAEYLREEVPEARVREDVGYEVAQQPEVMISDSGEIGLNHVLKGGSIKLANLKSALNHD